MCVTQIGELEGLANVQKNTSEGDSWRNASSSLAGETYDTRDIEWGITR